MYDSFCQGGSNMLIFDIETNGLLDELTKIHTITIYDSISDEFKSYDKDECSRAIELLNNADICGHNIIAFDIPAIKKIYPSFSPRSVTDTLVQLRLAYADIKERDVSQKNIPTKLYGSHSLKAWGYRLGVLKGDFAETTNWAEWSKEMSEYCKQDVVVTKAIFEHLKSKHSYLNCYANELEHKVQEIISRQIRKGFLFNYDKAEELYFTLLKRKSELLREFKNVFKPYLEADGDAFIPKVNNKERGYVKGVPLQKLKLVEFKPSSRQHIAYQFKKLYNWKPNVYTDSREPKVDEDVLASLDYPEAKLLSEYFLIEKRLSQLATGSQAWMSQVNNKDGRMHGYVNTCGAVTGRMTHSNPNIAQVPSVSIDKEGNYLYGSSGGYSTECRELFEVPKGYKLVGCDASGLELRTLSHYLAYYDNGAYANEVLNGDIHTANQKAANLPTRAAAKTFIYSYLYGGGDLRIGTSIATDDCLKYVGTKEYKTIKTKLLKDSFELNGKRYVKVTKGQWSELNDLLVCQACYGANIKEKFLANMPALSELRKAVAKKVTEAKVLKGLDGRILKVRSAHSALNVLLQSAGAIVMKQYLVMLDEKLQKEFRVGDDYEFVANIHDEVQIQVKEEFAQRVASICVEVFADVTKFFNFRIRLDGEAKVGNNWKETH
ncbi:DNA polymerase I [Campylobacter hyointestinalis subsp. hyointestinalis]|uniref:DNA-directed DNA polymerase n=1 Tax=Campylobacter hyointestinalis subsp. hyointestinalis TaxID=91352 RepID=A0A0S4RBK5_CAMHY|nr:DNA polymerase [Campylobacter hyointestinalis]CUU71263.1 DNA polymerase I [Campylobacter hyointestinalis subsp. hyointestinalis]